MEINTDDNHLMHIILQKPNENSTIEAQAHWNAHLQEWVKKGKPMSMSSN